MGEEEGKEGEGREVGEGNGGRGEGKGREGIGPQVTVEPGTLRALLRHCTPTIVAGVKRSSASVHVCVSVCSHDRTKTAETTIT